MSVALCGFAEIADATQGAQQPVPHVWCEFVLRHNLFALCCLLRRPLQGVCEWLDTLGRFNVPCALVSALDRATVQVRGTPSCWSHRHHFIVHNASGCFSVALQARVFPLLEQLLASSSNTFVSMRLSADVVLVGCALLASVHNS